MSNEMNDGQGTPHEVLVDEIMSISLETGKTEREWAARREIIKLKDALVESEAENAQLKASLTSAEAAYQSLSRMHEAAKRDWYAERDKLKAELAQGKHWR